MVNRSISGCKDNEDLIKKLMAEKPSRNQEYLKNLNK
jgi:hypothetical protein